MAQKWANWQPNPHRPGDPLRFKRGTKLEMAQNMDDRVLTPAGWGITNTSGMVTKVSYEPQVGRLAT